MKLDVLGLNHFDSRSATCQTVRPPSFTGSSCHLRIAPPHSSSAIPRLSRYHAASRLWSDVDLKNTPPIPVTRAITASSSSIHFLETAGNLNPFEAIPQTSGTSFPKLPAAFDGGAGLLFVSEEREHHRFATAREHL